MPLQPTFDELVRISRRGGEEYGQALDMLLTSSIRRRMRRVEHDRRSRDLVRPEMLQQQLHQPFSATLQVSRPIAMLRQPGRVQQVVAVNDQEGSGHGEGLYCACAFAVSRPE